MVKRFSTIFIFILLFVVSPGNIFAQGNNFCAEDGTCSCLLLISQSPQNSPCTQSKCSTNKDCIFGPIKNPFPDPVEVGFPKLFSNILRLLFVIAGLWSFFNIILAGYQFLSAGGDPKAIQSAWGRIWMSIVGLLIIVSSFIIAAIIGYVVFGDPRMILQPSILGPTPTP